MDNSPVLLTNYKVICNKKMLKDKKMKQIKFLIFTLLTLCTITVFGQTQNNSFEQIYKMVKQKNFFKAKETYNETKSNVSPTYQKIIEVFLDNAFGKLTESNQKIDELAREQFVSLSDSLQFALTSIKEDNSVKLYEYKEARKTTETLLDKYSKMLSTEEAESYQNNLKIWTALENQPKQMVTINESSKLQIKKDKVGMKNLTIKKDKDSLDFIFDTGANFSTVARSVAEKLKMNILSVSAEATSATGAKIPIGIAVCPEFHLGNITIQNAVFLVIDDKELSFSIPFFKYQVLGIIGFPVIEALKEIQITKDGYFIIPEKETVWNVSNMAMNGLTPLISIEGNPYIFDTGANSTTFHKPYYLANREDIEKKYKPKTIKFRSAGSKAKQKGYEIEAKLNVSDKDIVLKKVDVLKEKDTTEDGIWGRIGQDLIERFETMTLNFDQMFIKFD